MAFREDNEALILTIREYGQLGASSNLETFNGVTYWSNLQIQKISDNFREPKTVPVKHLNGTLWTMEIGNWYWADPATLDYKNQQGNSIVIDNTVNHYDNTLLITSGTPYYVFAMWVNLYDVLAEIWNIRASQRFDYIQMKAGANTLRLQNEYEHCRNQSEYYKNQIVRSFKR